VTLGLSKSINQNAGLSIHDSGLNAMTPRLLYRMNWIANGSHLSIGSQDSIIDFKINRKNFLRKHVFSRLELIVRFIGNTVKKTLLVALGALALVAAIATLGQIKPINQCAIITLNPLSIVVNACFLARGLINPFQFDDPDKMVEDVYRRFQGSGSNNSSSSSSSSNHIDYMSSHIPQQQQQQQQQQQGSLNQIYERNKRNGGNFIIGDEDLDDEDY
jgi:hypothetical protein